jgi:hypothetical protein
LVTGPDAASARNRRNRGKQFIRFMAFALALPEAREAGLRRSSHDFACRSEVLSLWRVRVVRVGEEAGNAFAVLCELKLLKQRHLLRVRR